jgi:SAM-dependent methyltransferase
MRLLIPISKLLPLNKFPTIHLSQSVLLHTSPDITKPDSWDRRFPLHKPRGQHILTNPRVLDAIVGRSGVGPDDTVLEVGPGTGNLTVRLLGAARHVTALEIDERMVEALRERVENLGLSHKLTVRGFLCFVCLINIYAHVVFVEIPQRGFEDYSWLKLATLLIIIFTGIICKLHRFFMVLSSI